MSGLANLKELLRDEREWCVAARVALHDGDARHYTVNEEGDYVISVLTLQHEVPINANWSMQPGWYSLPELNDEVMVAFDGGDFEGEAYIIGRTSSGRKVEDGEAGELAPGQTIMVSARIEGRASDKILMQAPEVEAASVPGAGGPLVPFDGFALWKAWVEAQFSAVGGHSHAVVGGATTTIVPVGTAPDVQGTEVLKGE